VAASVTFIDVVVAPLLHNNDPVKLEAVNEELAQLFATVTVGAEGIEFTVSVAALEFVEPVVLVHTARYFFELSATDAVKVKLGSMALVMFVHVVPPFELTCHFTAGAGVPLAAEVNVTLLPAQTVCGDGCVVTTGTLAAGEQLNEISFKTGVFVRSVVARTALY
jgi:hypothetical protein